MAACALCCAPAAIFCVNDDATLCAPCDVKFHANPLSARHTRRPLAASIPTAATSVADSLDDVAVVPQCAPSSPLARVAGPSSAAACSTMFEDMFAPSNMSFIDDPAQDPFPAPDFLSGAPFPASDSAADLMCFRFEDGVVPQADLFAPPAAPAMPPVNPLIKQEGNNDGGFCPSMMVPQIEAEAEGGMLYLDDDNEEEEAEVGEESEDEEEKLYRHVYRRAPTGYASRARCGQETAAAAGEAEPELTRQQRVQRYKEKRARRVFRKTVRYQSRKAYAEIRPRIKGRFVSPEEYNAYMTQQSDAVVPTF